MFPFDPRENIRKAKVFLCFQGDQKETLGRKGLNKSASFVIRKKLCGILFFILVLLAEIITS